MMKPNHLALCVLALLPIPLMAQTSEPAAAQTLNTNDHHADEVAIQQVMNQYHAAISTHDGAALSGLFLPEANLWLNVLTDSAYARARQSRRLPGKSVSATIVISRNWSPRQPKTSTRSTATS